MTVENERKRGRPRTGRKTVSVSVSVSEKLAIELKNLAEDNDVNLSRQIEYMLRSQMDPSQQNSRYVDYFVDATGERYARVFPPQTSMFEDVESEQILVGAAIANASNFTWVHAIGPAAFQFRRVHSDTWRILGFGDAQMSMEQDGRLDPSCVAQAVLKLGNVRATKKRLTEYYERLRKVGSVADPFVPLAAQRLIQTFSIVGVRASRSSDVEVAQKLPFAELSELEAHLNATGIGF